MYVVKNLVTVEEKLLESVYIYKLKNLYYYKDYSKESFSLNLLKRITPNSLVKISAILSFESINKAYRFLYLISSLIKW